MSYMPLQVPSGCGGAMIRALGRELEEILASTGSRISSDSPNERFVLAMQASSTLLSMSVALEGNAVRSSSRLTRATVRNLRPAVDLLISNCGDHIRGIIAAGNYEELESHIEGAVTGAQQLLLMHDVLERGGAIRRHVRSAAGADFTLVPPEVKAATVA